MTRRLALWLGIPLGVVVLLVIAAAFALHAPGGLRWAFDRLVPVVPGELSADRVAGSLAGPWRIEGVHYRDGQGLEVDLDGLTLSWRPLALLAGQLRVEHLNGRTLVVRLPPGDDGDGTATYTPPPRLPLGVVIDLFHLEDVVVRSDEQSPLHLDSVTLSGGSIMPLSGIRARSLEVAAPTGRLRLGGRVNPWFDLDHMIDGEARIELPGRPGVSATFALEGTQETTRITLEADGPAHASLEGTLTSLLGPLEWEGRLQARAADLSGLDPGLPPWPAEAAFEGRGTVARFAGNVTAALEHPEFGRVTADGGVDGDSSRVGVAQLTVRMDESAARLRLASGAVTLGDGAPRFEAGGSWQAMRWPLEGPPTIASPAGRFEVAGTAEAYRFDLSGRLESPDLPPVDLAVEGEGGTTRARFDAWTLALAGEGGRLRGDGEVAWQPVLSGTLRGEAEGLDPARFASAWPGRLDGRFTVEGQLAEEGPRWQAELHALSGRLRDHPVTARGRASGRGERIDLRQIELSAGILEASLEGVFGPRLDLQWRLASASLDGLLGQVPDLEGSLSAHGRLVGPRDAPTLAFEAEAGGLRRGALEARRVTAGGRVGVGGGGPLDFNLSARDLRVGGRQVARVDLTGEGALADHRIVLDVEADAHTIGLALEGGLNAEAWQGVLTRGQVGLRGWGALELERPASLAVAADRATLADHCWRRLREGTPQPGELCAGGQWRADGRWQADLRLAELSLALFDLALPEGVTLDGELAGEARFSGTEKGLDGRGELRLGAGHVDATGLVGGGAPVAFAGGTAEVIAGPEGASASFRLDLGGEDRVEGKIALPDIVPGQAVPPDSAVDGEMRLELTRTDLFSALLPTLAFGPGRVEGRLELDGTVATPRLGGRATVRLETVEVAEYGVVLNELELRARDEEGKALRVEGGVTSGEGRLDLDGRLAPDSETGWRLALTVAGERFTAVDLHELRLLVSPDLEMTLNGRDLALSGRVEVPEALARPQFGGTSVRGTSADAVVVGETGPREPADPLRIDASLHLVLGDRVRFEGFGLAGEVTGALDIEQRPDALPLARGELRLLDGSFNRYGQDLKIESGRLQYANSPLDNPAIDARAVRRVGQVKVGVRLHGRLQSMETTVFSEPPMSQADALSYLVLGSPAGQSGGSGAGEVAAASAALGYLVDRTGIEGLSVESDTVGDAMSLVLGRYLTPDLYVGYALGLASPTNTFVARYRLTERLSVEASSGTGDSGAFSGADLKYEIER